MPHGSQFVLSPLGSWETIFGRTALICTKRPVVCHTALVLSNLPECGNHTISDQTCEDYIKKSQDYVSSPKMRGIIGA